LIMDRSKILCMFVENLHYLDSLKFLPMSFNSMHKSFDLTCKKGYLPHFLTLPTIWIMWALIPNTYYGADFMLGDDRSQFSTRYRGVKGNIFNNREELLVYCMVDVNVLRQPCCALLLILFNKDPFRQAMTLSSICNKVFRTMFLNPIL